VSEEGYLEALGSLTDWDHDMTENEQTIAEVISLNVFRSSLYVASCVKGGPTMNERSSLFLGLRSRNERNDDESRMADAARFMFTYLQKELGSQQLDTHRDSPMDAASYY